MTTETVIADLNSKTLEEVRTNYDALVAEISLKKYKHNLNRTQVLFLIDYFKDIKFIGKSCFDISEIMSNLILLKSNIDEQLNGNSIKQFFNYIYHAEFVGSNKANNVKDILMSLSKAIEEINVDFQLIKDASLELESKEQGISIENMVEGIQEDEAKEVKGKKSKKSVTV